MRDLKFRAWHWFRMDYVDVLINAEWKLEEPDWDCAWTSKVSGNYIIMQYTGLKDKNGKEIYESDLLEYPDSYVWTDEASIAEIIYWESMRLEGVWIDCYIDYNSFKNCEIIGNIYENPDLLTK